jgi:CBS domain-containing protein
MSTKLVKAEQDSTIADAAARMVASRTGSAIIMQGAFLAGILTERDVLRAVASGEDVREVTVSEWMTPDPQWAAPDATPEEAAQIMLLNGFRHLPVVDGREVCGVVSLRELFAARIRR